MPAHPARPRLHASDASRRPGYRLSRLSCHTDCTMPDLLSPDAPPAQTQTRDEAIGPLARIATEDAPARIASRRVAEAAAREEQESGRRIGPLARQAVSLKVAGELREQLRGPARRPADVSQAPTAMSRHRSRGSSRQARPPRRTRRATACSPGALAGADDDPSPRPPLSAAEREVLRQLVSRRRSRALHRERGLRESLGFVKERRR